MANGVSDWLDRIGLLVSLMFMDTSCRVVLRIRVAIPAQPLDRAGPLRPTPYSAACPQAHYCGPSTGEVTAMEKGCQTKNHLPFRKSEKCQDVRRPARLGASVAIPGGK